MNKIVNILLTAVLSCSCSVKEDRLACPGRIVFDASRFWGLSDVVCLNLTAEGRNVGDTLNVKRGQFSMECDVRKGLVEAYAFSNLRNSVENDGIVTIPVGKQADDLRAYCCRVNCSAEQVLVKAEPNRQSASVHLKLHNGSGNYPYRLQLCGDVCGIDLRSMTPVEGAFSYELELDDDLSCEFRIPRQKPGGRTVINVLSGGSVVEVFPLHSWIQAAGYDWTRADLSKIFLDIDQEQLRVMVNVQGWEHEEFEIIL